MKSDRCEARSPSETKNRQARSSHSYCHRRLELAPFERVVTPPLGRPTALGRRSEGSIWHFVLTDRGSRDAQWGSAARERGIRFMHRRGIGRCAWCQHARYARFSGPGIRTQHAIQELNQPQVGGMALDLNQIVPRCAAKLPAKLGDPCARNPEWAAGGGL